MAEFTGDLNGADFDGADLTGARFYKVTLANTRMHEVDLSGSIIRGALLVDLDLDGYVENLRINGVDVGPLIEAELDRRYPQRKKLNPADAAGFREAWAVIEQSWPATVERARRLPPRLLHERVEGEWSFIETLRHLVFATDAWVKRAYLGELIPYDPLDLPHTEMADDPVVPRDLDARPSLDEVLALRADRMATVRKVMAELTDEVLDGRTEPIAAPGYPEAGDYEVRRCLRAVVNEEWLHRQFAERDLAVLEARS